MGAVRFKITVRREADYDIPLELAERAVHAYREKYSTVVSMWYKVERAAIAAVKRHGSVQICCANGRVAWGMSKNFPDFLVCRLPSGRHLWYYKPEIVTVPWFEKTKEELRYWGEDPKTHQWTQLKTYGGALVENITQAIARDVMANGMLNVTKTGYELILTIHDELVAEANSLTVDQFVDRMCELPAWAKGLPIAAEGWSGDRYRK